MSIKKPNINISSETWFELENYYKERLDLLRLKNDSPLSIEETERLRGQIFEIKNLLSFSKKP